MARIRTPFKPSALALTAVVALALTGCSSGSTPVATASPTAEKQYVTAPLTGVRYEVESAEAAGLSHPSVACKIDNSDAARPQLGLNSTDMVVDEMVEGGLTRFVAIFQSNQPTAVGPVRSVRPMDPDILSPLGGIVCYSGGQAAITAMMRATNVFNADETSEQGQGTFTRVKDRVAPHNVIVNVALLAQHHPEIAAPAAQFNFAQDAAHSTAALSGSAIQQLKVIFPAALALWTPSADGTQFLRTQDGKPLTDAADGSQIHATNVVVMQVTVDRSFKDPKYGFVPKDVTIGTGHGWVLSAGKVIEVNWSKASRTESIVLTTLDGKPVQLAPGNTWVELQPIDVGKTEIALSPSASATPTATPTKANN